MGTRLTCCSAELFSNECGYLQLSHNKQPCRHLQRCLRTSGWTCILPPSSLPWP